MSLGDKCFLFLFFFLNMYVRVDSKDAGDSDVFLLSVRILFLSNMKRGFYFITEGIA